MTRVEHLRALLAAYRTSDPREAGYVRRMSQLLEIGEAAFARHRFEPGHFTASAFVLSPDRRRLLLILHAKLGMWLQPGGHVDPDDGDIVAAARRELSEEVGIGEAEWLGEGIFDVDIHEIPTGRDPAHQHFDVRFLFRAPSENVVASSDARAARWVALDGMAAVHSDASVMRAVERLRASYPWSLP